jgi:hypothetical protein
VDVNIDELRRRLPPAKQMASDLYGVKWRRGRARCPRGENHAHGDRDPSFAYLSKEDRLHCFSQRCFGDKPVLISSGRWRDAIFQARRGG